jgi:hypothetical protein
MKKRISELYNKTKVSFKLWWALDEKISGWDYFALSVVVLVSIIIGARFF